MSAPSGSAATSSARRSCSALLYATTGGHALGGASEPAEGAMAHLGDARDEVIGQLPEGMGLAPNPLCPLSLCYN